MEKNIKQPKLRTLETTMYKCGCGAEMNHMCDAGTPPSYVKCWRCKNKAEKIGE